MTWQSLLCRRVQANLQITADVGTNVADLAVRQRMEFMFKRRQLLHASLAASTTLVLNSTLRSQAQSASGEYGVASGDPRPDRVTLWTRLSDATITAGVIPVTYRVSRSADLSNPVFVGQVQTSAAVDYTVKVTVNNLEPFTRYYYGFQTNTGYTSVIGRTKTAPATNAEPNRIQFAFVSCQDFTQGFYSVYRNLARQDDIDFCVHLGDTIYETGASNFQNGQVRLDNIGGGESTTLAEYREKYKLYLSDPAWREVRRLFPWIILWDDHELFDNYAGTTLTAADYPRQRSAYQAFLEYQPVQPEEPLSSTNPPQVRLYRNFVFGNLMEMFVLDERQYRDGLACETDFLSFGCRALNQSNRTMLGQTQKQWLQDGLANSTRRWKFLLSEVMVQQFLLTNFDRGSRRLTDQLFPQAREITPGLFLNLDAWDGYPAERTQLLEFIRDRNIDNVVVCTGDIHNCYAGELRPDFQNLNQPSVGVEVVTGSVSSAGIGELSGRNLNRLGNRLILGANPSMRYLDVFYHVFTKMVVTPAQVQVSYEAVRTILRPQSLAFTLQSFTIPNGESRLQF